MNPPEERGDLQMLLQASTFSMGDKTQDTYPWGYSVRH